MFDGIVNTSPSPSDSDLPLDLLEREITLLAAHLNAASYRLLVLLAEFDRRGGQGVAGRRGCAARGGARFM
jgi:hypothetical protein